MTPLNDAQLKAFMVGTACWGRNNVTGEQFSENFTTEGPRSCSESDRARRSRLQTGDTYQGEHSNEFGYANYEIIPAPQIAENPLTTLANQFSTTLGLNSPFASRCFCWRCSWCSPMKSASNRSSVHSTPA